MLQTVVDGIEVSEYFIRIDEIFKNPLIIFEAGRIIKQTQSSNGIN